jgi:hypothetical protein
MKGISPRMKKGRASKANPAGFYGGTGICSGIRYGAVFWRQRGVEDHKRGTKHAWEPWGMRLVQNCMGVPAARLLEEGERQP